MLWQDAALAVTAEPVSPSSEIEWHQQPQQPLTPMANEITPDILPGGWRSYYVTTQQTYRCDTPDNLLTEPVDCTGPHVHMITSPDYVWHGTTAFPLNPPPGREFGYDHRMAYNGVFGAVPVRAATGADYIVAVNHGENKNIMRPDLELYWKGQGATEADKWLWFYQNTVFTQAAARAPGYLLPDSPPDCYSGYEAGVYRDCYPAYSAFVSTANSPSNAANGWGNAAMTDRGPAVWPKWGYTSHNGTQRASNGVRHPSVIDGGDGYLYMYYVDTGRTINDANGRWTGYNVDDGVRVARSPTTSLGVGWEIWVADSRSWEPALPAGVGPRFMSTAFGSPSPAQSQRLFESSTATFNVAKVRGQRRWIGVELRTEYGEPQCAPGKYWQRIALRVGESPTDWSPNPIYLTGSHAAEFESCGVDLVHRMAYPRLVSDDGWSTKEVDASGFHIIGRSDDEKLHKVRVSMTGLAP